MKQLVKGTARTVLAIVSVLVLLTLQCIRAISFRIHPIAVYRLPSGGTYVINKECYSSDLVAAVGFLTLLSGEGYIGTVELSGKAAEFRFDVLGDYPASSIDTVTVNGQSAVVLRGSGLDIATLH